jgi:hypothetical protein
VDSADCLVDVSEQVGDGGLATECIHVYTEAQDYQKSNLQLLTS